MEEFRRLAFEGVADELEHPSGDEETERIRPKAMEEDAAEKQWEREQDSRYSQSMADPVYGMLMAGSILRDPLLASAVA